MARLKVEAVSPDPVKQLPNVPRLLSALNGCVIGWISNQFATTQKSQTSD
jgi:hypothetical protein